MEIKPLWEDQISSDAWLELCDYAYNDPDYKEPYTNDRANKSNGRLKIFTKKDEIGLSGVIFCGTTQDIKYCLKSIPENGNYILITRDNDQSIAQEFFAIKPKSVKHWFSVNCPISNPEITAMPVGCNTLGSDNNNLKIVANSTNRIHDGNWVYARLNIPGEMRYPHERHECLFGLERNSPIATIIYKQIDGLEMCSGMRTHPFVASPIGTGMDCLRTWESITLGAIPIVTDCSEYRQFEDMPIAFVKYWTDVTDQWCKDQLELLKNKSTERVRMSYWKQQLFIQRELYGI